METAVTAALSVLAAIFTVLVGATQLLEFIDKRRTRKKGIAVPALSPSTQLESQPTSAVHVDPVTLIESQLAELPGGLSETRRVMKIFALSFGIGQMETVDSATIAEYFRRLRWPKPANISAILNRCAKKGWIVESGMSQNRKLWRITRRGLDEFK